MGETLEEDGKLLPIGWRVVQVAAAVIAAVALAGLALRFAVVFEATASIGSTLWVMARTFTVLTNFLVVLLMTGIALYRRACRSSFLLAGLTLAILLVAAVHAALLRGNVQLSGAALIADILLHQAVPLLLVMFWLLLWPKGGLRWRDPPLWSLYPIGYLGYALLRGAVEGRYAYPFIDPARAGWISVGVTCLVIATAFIFSGFILVSLDRLLSRRAGRSHQLKV